MKCRRTFGLQPHGSRPGGDGVAKLSSNTRAWDGFGDMHLKALAAIAKAKGE